MPPADLKDLVPVFAAAIAAFAALLGVAISSAFNLRTARMNIEAQRSQKELELRLQRLEELYVLFDKWQMNFSNVYLTHLSCYQNQLTFKQVMETVRSFDLIKPGEAQRMTMLLEIHFPNLSVSYQQVEKARARIVPFLKDPSSAQSSVQDFVSAQKSFEEASDQFKSAIAALPWQKIGCQGAP